MSESLSSVVITGLITWWSNQVQVERDKCYPYIEYFLGVCHPSSKTEVFEFGQFRMAAFSVAVLLVVSACLQFASGIRFESDGTFVTVPFLEYALGELKSRVPDGVKILDHHLGSLGSENVRGEWKGFMQLLEDDDGGATCTVCRVGEGWWLWASLSACLSVFSFSLSLFVPLAPFSPMSSHLSPYLPVFTILKAKSVIISGKLLLPVISYNNYWHFL